MAQGLPNEASGVAGGGELAPKVVGLVHLRLPGAAMSIDSLEEGRDSTQGCASKHAELPQAWLTLRSRLNYPGARLQRNPVNVGTLPLPPSSLSPT